MNFKGVAQEEDEWRSLKKNKKTMRKMLKHEIYCEDGYHQSTFAVLERAAAEIELFM